ncbi:MAG TPA: hypothetical protein DD435_17080 [Cyanobacteria bacterium UBA8530]|nr:hypothetical protein [Cyanobacteria bacterium UBA8530]
MRRLFKWLVPGLKIKRWVFLTLAGMLLANIGVASLTLAIYVHLYRGRHETQLFWLGALLLAVGAVLTFRGARRTIRSVVQAIAPMRRIGLLDAFYENRTKSRGPKIVVIGGGTGLSTVLRGLKHYSENITAVVAMADDGGSSGRLRADLGMLPPGDIRSCLTALAEEEDFLTRLFQYRFDKGELSGHSFGNLFLAAMSAITGDLPSAIRQSSKVLAVQGQVLPATLDSLILVARLRDGRIVRGESTISKLPDPIAQVWLEPQEPRALPEAVNAIREADAIILGPGSLYTSIVPNLLIPEIRQALQASRAHKIYICNVMTQPGETDGFRASDHVRVLRAYGADLFDAVMANRQLPSRLLANYQKNEQFPVEIDEDLQKFGVRVFVSDLLDETDLVRHDHTALARSIMDWLAFSKGETALGSLTCLFGEKP